MSSSLLRKLNEDTRQTEDILRVHQEGLSKLRSDLNDLYRKELGTIKSDIVRLLSWKLLIPASLMLSIMIGAGGGAWAMSSYILSQSERIMENRFELSAQEEALQKGRFFRHPETGERFVAIVPGSAYQSQGGEHWARMSIRE